jgi:hypothetical protein
LRTLAIARLRRTITLLSGFLAIIYFLDRKSTKLPQKELFANYFFPFYISPGKK